MGLIIGKTIKMLQVGFPTVSDKYNVTGAVLVGDKKVKFGELVKFSDTEGYFEGISGAVQLSEIAGIVLGTNVKLADGFPGTEVYTYPHEAFNLLLNGFVAVELDENASIEDKDAVAAEFELTEDVAIDDDKDYYTRASNSDGAGYLNDGTYKYTLVANPIVDNIGTYYEAIELGSDAETDKAKAGNQVAVLLATGKLTTSGAAGATDLPGYKFTGTKEFHGTKKCAEIIVN